MSSAALEVGFEDGDLQQVSLLRWIGRKRRMETRAARIQNSQGRFLAGRRVNDQRNR